MDNEQLILSLSAYILNAYKKRQSIDQVYIRDLANIVISNLNLDYFISDITIGDLSKRSLACYYLDTKSIVIDLNKIIRRLVSINNPHINYANRLLFYYLEVAEILLHEIEHSNQIKKIAYHEPNLETKILTASAIFSYFRSDLNKYNLLIDLGYSEEQLKLYFNQKIMTYYNNYNIVPEERMANYYASLIIIKILKKFKNNHNLNYIIF